LKPANVFLTRGGAKLLDFGLAAMRQAAAADLSQLATEPVPITAEGSVVGTLHYLAPERLDGRAADERSDIYAFGAILYEMLAGSKAFDEPTQARMISAILTRDPAPLTVASPLPSELGAVVMTLLCKDPDDRWQSAGDVAKMLRGIAARLGTPPPSAPVIGSMAHRWPLLVAALAVAALAVVGTLTWRREALTPTPRVPVSFLVGPPAGGALGLTSATVASAQFAVSPDGTSVVFVAKGQDGHEQLFIRRFDEVELRPLVGTRDATYPFWSPDSRQVGFFADQQLKTIAVAGGPAQSICQVNNGRGGTWSSAGEIIYAAADNPLFRVSISERIPSELGPLPAGQTGQRWPQLLPGEKRLLLWARSTDPNVEGIYVMSLDNPSQPQRLRGAVGNGVYASNHLLYVQDGVLVAERFDSDTLRLSGEILPLGLPVSGSSTRYSAVSVSTTGVLATWAAGEASSELVWFSRRTGQPIGKIGSPARYVDFQLSPEGDRLVFARVDPGENTSDLWHFDLVRQIPTPLTSNPDTDATPVWAASGKRLIFRSNRNGRVHEIFERPAHAGADDTMLHSTGGGTYPTDWSRDENLVLYHESHRETGYDLSLFDFATRKARNLTPAKYDQAQGHFGTAQRVAYMSTEAGEPNVFVRRLDGEGGSERISSTAGFDPRWSADGRELYFLDPAGRLMAAQFPDGGLRPAAVKELFQIHLPAPAAPYLSNYDAAADGQKFLFRVPLQLPHLVPITVTLDWQRRLSPR
jgi:Tol biopolymer transport system component